MRLGILGGGRAAWAYGSAWRRIGRPLAGVWLRNESTSSIATLLGTPRRSMDDLAAGSDLLLVAVSDRAIVDVANGIPDSRAIVFHASGALTGLRGGFSLHPLKSLPPVGEPSRLDDALLVFEGNHRDVAQAVLLLAVIAEPFAVIGDEKNRRLFVQLMGLQVSHEPSDDIVRLAHSAIANWRAGEGRGRFTGPAIRGDRETVERHIAALIDRPQVAKIYALLAEELARRGRG